MSLPAKKRELTSLACADMTPILVLIPEDWPALWRDMAQVFYSSLIDGKRLEVDAEALAIASIDLVLSFAREFGGEQPFIPTGKNFAVKAVVQSIAEQANRHNYRELARLHGLSESRIRQIEKAHRTATATATRTAVQKTTRHS